VRRMESGAGFRKVHLDAVGCDEAVGDVSHL
jgi:hypothetical protein